MSGVRTSLLKKLNEFRKTGEFCDIRLKVGNKFFDCHRVILASSTDFFRLLFKPNYRESTQEIVELHEVDERVFETLLNFIYCGDLEVLEKDIPNVLAACVYFQLKEGEEICVNLVKYNLHTVNIFELFSLPCLRYKQDLYDIVKKYICEHFSELIHSEEFHIIPFEQLSEILLAAELMVYDIKDIINSCIKWICFDIENRSEYLVELTKLVNTNFIPPDGLLNLISNIDKVPDKEKCFELLFNGVLYTEQIHPRINLSNEPLFISKKSDIDNPFLIKFKCGSWVQIDDLRFIRALSSDLFAEATLLHQNLYLSCGLFSNISALSANDRAAAGIAEASGVPFYSCNLETKKWQSLYPSSCISNDLIPCNSKIYLYNELSTDYQFFSYLPCLNRWLTIPSLNVPRSKAGVASDGRFVYVIGGKPNIEPTPCNMIEFYDDRCKNWQTLIPNKKLRMNLLRNRYTKKVCFLDGFLYTFSRRSMEVFDQRANKWRTISDIPEVIYNHCSAKRSYLIPVHRELWYISCQQNIFSYDPRMNVWNDGPDGDGYFLKPVQIIR